VQQDTRAAGEILVETLLKLINKEPVDNQVIPVTLLVRGSTGRDQARSTADTMRRAS